MNTSLEILTRKQARFAMGFFGEENRACQLMEELAEALTAASHYRRGRAGARDELVEELADVLLQVEQWCHHMGMGEDIAACVADKRAAFLAHLQDVSGVTLAEIEQSRLEDSDDHAL